MVFKCRNRGLAFLQSRSIGSFSPLCTSKTHRRSVYWKEQGHLKLFIFFVELTHDRLTHLIDAPVAYIVLLPPVFAHYNLLKQIKFRVTSSKSFAKFSGLRVNMNSGFLPLDLNRGQKFIFFFKKKNHISENCHGLSSDFSSKIVKVLKVPKSIFVVACDPQFPHCSNIVSSTV